MAIPEDPDTLLRRRQLAAALQEEGFPVEATTLATKAVRGGGPPFELFGRIPLYRWGPSLGWAKGRLSTPRRSTSEADAPPERGAIPVTHGGHRQPTERKKTA